MHRLKEDFRFIIVFAMFHINHIRLGRQAKREVLNRHLFENVSKGYELGIELALKLGAEIEAKDCCGRTPLILAIDKNQELSVRALLRYGADVNQVDSICMRTPLLWAIVEYRKNDGIVSILLDAGADVLARDSDGLTALMLASWIGFTNLAQILIERGADAFAADDQDMTVLDYANRYGRGDVKTLLTAYTERCHLDGMIEEAEEYEEDDVLSI